MITSKDWAINLEKNSACRHKALFDLGINFYGTSNFLDSQEALENHLHIDVDNDLQVKKSLDFTYEEYKAALADAEKEYDSLQYYRDRRLQYPNTQDIVVALAG